LLGRPMVLRIGGRATHQTMYGAILTLISLSLTFWSGLGYFSDFLDHSKPSIVESSTETYNFPKMELGSDGIAPIFLLMLNNEVITASEIQKYITIMVYSFKRNLDDSVEPNKFTLLNPSVPCNQLSAEKLTRMYPYSHVDDEAFLNGFQKDSICIDPQPEMFFVQGRLSDRFRHTILIDVLPCGLENCAEIQPTDSLALILVNPSFSFEPNDFNRPIKSIPKFNPILTLNPKSHTRFEHLLKRNLVYDSTGIFRKESLTKNYTTIDEVIKVVNTRDESFQRCFPGFYCEPYLTIEYKATGSSVKTVRVYKSLLDTLASIGGMNKVISMAVGIVYALLHFFASGNLLVRGIFELREETISAYLRTLGINPKTSDPKLVGRVKREFSRCAKSIIDDHLDVFTLVKEISRIRLIADMLLHPGLRKVETFISLSEELKRISKDHSTRNTKKTVSTHASNQVIGIESNEKTASNLSFEQEIDLILKSSKSTEWKKHPEDKDLDVFNNAEIDEQPFAAQPFQPPQLNLAISIKDSTSFLAKKLHESRQTWIEACLKPAEASEMINRPKAATLGNSLDNPHHHLPIQLNESMQRITKKRLRLAIN